MLLEKFYPDAWVDSTYQIDFDRLYERGYRGLIFDIDNTLVPHGAPADDRAKALFAHLKKLGFSCCLLSNNSSREWRCSTGMCRFLSLRMPTSLPEKITGEPAA